MHNLIFRIREMCIQMIQKPPISPDPLESFRCDRNKTHAVDRLREAACKQRYIMPAPGKPGG